MVTIELAGRLGNYLFQVAAVYAYAIKYEMNYCIPKHEVYAPWFKNIAHVDYAEWNKMVQTYSRYKEPRHPYTQIPEYNDVVLQGYYQSYKYFEQYRDEVLDLFSLPYQLQKGTVSVHVRRGDYTLHPNHFPPVTAKYVITAITEMLQRGCSRFKVFSDDVPWCRQHLQVSGAELQFMEGGSPLDDLIAMANCEHNIIANSSFSWWAAWLNRNPHKHVIMPGTWFGPMNKHLKTYDMCPSDWQRINF